MISETKRSELEIIAQILSSSKEKIRKTNLMSKANLNYPNFIKFLHYLEDKGLIDEYNGTSNTEYYQISTNGKQILQRIELLMKDLY